MPVYTVSFTICEPFSVYLWFVTDVPLAYALEVRIPSSGYGVSERMKSSYSSLVAPQRTVTKRSFSSL